MSSQEYEAQVAAWEKEELVKYPAWNPYDKVKPNWAHFPNLSEIFARNLRGYPMWIRADSPQVDKDNFIKEILARKEIIEPYVQKKIHQFCR